MVQEWLSVQNPISGKHIRNKGTDVFVSLVDCVNGVNKLGRGLMLGHIAGGSIIHRLANNRTVPRHGDDEYPRVSGSRTNSFGGGEPIDIGHPDVHEDHVRRQFFRQVHRFLSVLCLADDFDVIYSSQKGAQAAPRKSVVIYND